MHRNRGAQPLGAPTEVSGSSYQVTFGYDGAFTATPRGLVPATKSTGTVQTNGRVTNCRVTRSSGVPELDGLTCRLIEQRFVYRPATDRTGRPVTDEVEIEWTWD